MKVEQRADEEPAGHADQHSERAADDPDQQAGEASAGGAGQERRFDPVLFDHLPVLAADDDDGLPDPHPLLRVKLVEQRQGVVRVAVILEGDGNRVVRAEPLGDKVVG